MSGTLYLIGTGPGDPELLTLKAARVLSALDGVAYPQKPGTISQSLTIAETHLSDSVEHFAFDVPMAVDRGPAQLAYDQMAAELAPKLAAGQNIGYLCEGDPLFYGSAMYLLHRMPDAQIEIIPGITSLTAAAAEIKRPLAARNERLKVLPAPMESTALDAELAASEAVALIKIGRHFDRVRDALNKTGHGDSAMVVEYATRETQKITKLADYPQGERPYFSIILSYKGDEAWGS